MSRREIVMRDYPTSADRLWNALKLALTEADGMSLLTADDSQRVATFQTGTTWTSWGQNMRATIQELDANRARLSVTGQRRATFMSSNWGERIHGQTVVRRLGPAIDDALACLR